MPDTDKKLNVQMMLAVLIIILGFVLMIGKIVADSEPGGIPILLILVGTTWFVILSMRRRSHRS